MPDKTILIVDDDRAIRDVLSSYLSTHYSILQAASYAEAMRFSISSVDLALIDYLLPDSDGFTVLRSVRQINPSLAVIVMTGFGDEEVVLRALRAEVADYLKKPFDLAYVRRRIEEILQKGPRRTAVLKGPRQHVPLDMIAHYIEENYADRLTLDTLARLACMSRFNFCRAFKGRFKQCCISYINAIRIKNAVRLLETTSASITDIAFSVGYGNVGHFNRIFKAVCKVSPRAYRRTARDDPGEKEELFSPKLSRQCFSQLFSKEQEYPEGREHQPHIESERGCPEDCIPYGMVYDKQLEKQGDEDRNEYQRVRKKTARECGFALGAACEHIPDLRDNDRRETRRRRSQIKRIVRGQMRPPYPSTPVQDVKKTEHASDRLDGTEKEIRPHHQTHVQELFAHLPRWTLHHTRSGTFSAERERGEHVGPEIDREDLDDRERERDFEHDIREIGDRLRNVRRKNIR